jgi:hypothetical protein
MVCWFCGLFNDAVSSSDYIGSNGGMIGKLFIGQDLERSGRGLIVIPVFAWRN